MPELISRHRIGCWLRGWAQPQRRLDAVMALVLTASVAACLAVDRELSRPNLVAALCLMAAVAIVGSCRRWPVPAAVVASGLLVGSGVIGRSAVLNANGLDVPVFLAVFCYAYALGTDRRWMPSLSALLLLTAGFSVAGDSYPWHDFNPLAEMATLGPWLAGQLVASRRRLAAQLERRAHELDEEREVFAVASVRYERARIARELHDIVAHCVSLMVVQASAGEHLTLSDPASAAEAFASISEAARQAEAEIGRLMALLDTSARAGQPVGLRVIDELVDRVRATGLRVSCRISGDGGEVPAPLAETAYRLVQEAITNALKHAPGAAIAVTIHNDRDTVRVEVTNDEPLHEMLPALREVGGGHGLAGMRERIDRGGGTFHAGPTASPGWQVSAYLPLRPSVKVGHSPAGVDP